MHKSGEIAAGDLLAEGELRKRLPKGIKSVIGVAPAEAIALRSVEIPTKRRANVEAAIPYALEETLSQEVDDLHFSMLDWEPGKRAHVAVISRVQLEHWLDDLAEAGLEVDAIVPEQRLLPLHSDSDITIARTGANRICIREGENGGLVMDEQAFDYWWQSQADRSVRLAVNDRQIAHELASHGGENVNQWDIGRDFRDWLEHHDQASFERFSMLQGEYEPEHLKPSTWGMMLAAALAGLAFLLLFASNWWELRKLEAEVEHNQTEIRALFAKTFPKEEYLGVPRRQVASLLALDEGGNDHLFQYMLDIAAETVPQHNASFDEVNFRDGSLQVGVTVPNFAELDKLTAAMAGKDGIEARLISSGSKDNTVTGQIKMVRR